MSNMTSEGNAGSKSDSGKKERLLVTSVGPGREGCRMARPEINQIHILCILHRMSERFWTKLSFVDLTVACFGLLFGGIPRVTSEYNGQYHKCGLLKEKNLQKLSTTCSETVMAASRG